MKTTSVPFFWIQPQPDDTTCGPTSLQAVYRHFGDRIALSRLIQEVPVLRHGGTLGVLLGCHALERGYLATLYSWNLQVFDPTWRGRNRSFLMRKLMLQARVKKNRKLRWATKGYLRFLNAGGEIRFDELTPRLLQENFQAGKPIIAGLSSTYLYQSPRERNRDNIPDDVRGYPQGHFVVLYGIDKPRRNVFVADPLKENPFSPRGRYCISMDRFFASVFLGIVTYDANFLVISPRKKP